VTNSVLPRRPRFFLPRERLICARYVTLKGTSFAISAQLVRGKLSDRNSAISRGKRRPWEEVSVMEVYWQLILRAGCARFVGHDTLPSRRATGKPTRDVLRRPTESNARPPPLRFHPVDADPLLIRGCRASLSVAPEVYCSPKYLRCSRDAHQPDRAYLTYVSGITSFRRGPDSIPRAKSTKRVRFNHDVNAGNAELIALHVSFIVIIAHFPLNYPRQHRRQHSAELVVRNRFL